jgi:hypothetical protein
MSKVICLSINGGASQGECYHASVKRRIFNLLAALSLLLLLAVVALWVRSGWVVDEVKRDANWSSSSKWQGTMVGLASWKGHIEVILDYNRIRANGGITGYQIGKPFLWTRWPAYLRGWQQDYPRWQLCGLYNCVESSEMVRGGIIYSNDPDWITEHYGAPDLLLVALLAVLPAFWLVRFTRSCQQRRRTALFLCTKCGCDLRANPHRCPECGTVTADKALPGGRGSANSVVTAPR